MADLPNVHGIHPEVPEFMVNQLDGAQHPAINGSASSGVMYRSSGNNIYNTVSNTGASPTEVYQGCLVPAKEMIETANKYLKRKDQPLLDIASSDGWQTVEDSMLAACNVLDTLSTKDKDTSGFTGKIKSAFRGLCEKAGVGLAFTSLVPNEVPCSSVLCGGLKAVFTALERSHNYREDVYRAIEDIPFIINDHAVYIEIHMEDDELHRRNAALYVALFRLLQQILLWFVKNPAAIAMKLLVNPNGFTESLQQRLVEVKTAGVRFEKHALLLRNKRDDQSIKLQHWMAYNVGKAIEGLDEMRAERRTVLEKLTQMLNQTHPQVMMELAQNARKTRQAMIADEPAVVTVRDSLLEVLERGAALLKSDLEELLKDRIGSGSHLESDRIVAFQGSPQLSAWLSLNCSSTLLVDGGCSQTGSREISFVAAQVMETAIRVSTDESSQSGHATSVIPLAFFCSCHPDRRRDRYGRPEGLATALLSQLIERHHDFRAKDLQKCQDTLTEEGTATVCKAFRRLIRKLPANAIVILVVEGVDILIHDKTVSELKQVLRSLVEGQDAKHKAVVKLLVTCTTSSLGLEGVFDEQDILRIPRMLNSSGSYRSLKWKDSSSLGGFRA